MTCVSAKVQWKYSVIIRPCSKWLLLGRSCRCKWEYTPNSKDGDKNGSKQYKSTIMRG